MSDEQFSTILNGCWRTEGCQSPDKCWERAVCADDGVRALLTRQRFRMIKTLDFFEIPIGVFDRYEIDFAAAYENYGASPHKKYPPSYNDLDAQRTTTQQPITPLSVFQRED